LPTRCWPSRSKCETSSTSRCRRSRHREG
jgi:hypothetical protein